MSTTGTSQKKENILPELVFNILAPVIILSKLSAADKLGPLYALILALSIPLAYGLYDLLVNKKKNLFSVLGFVSILLTGIIGVFEFPAEYIAIKEAFIPFIIGVVVLVSTWTRFPLVKKLVYNENILNIKKIESQLASFGRFASLEKILVKASVLLSVSFFISSALNFILAKVLVKSSPGTVEFNEELGMMTMWSFPVIAVPSMIFMLLAFWYLFNSLKKITALTSEEIMAERFKS